MTTNCEIVKKPAYPQVRDEESRDCGLSRNAAESPLSIWGPKLVALML